MGRFSRIYVALSYLATYFSNSGVSLFSGVVRRNGVFCVRDHQLPTARTVMWRRRSDRGVAGGRLLMKGATGLSQPTHTHTHTISDQFP